MDGTKLKGKSFVKREPVTDVLWENHLKGIEPSLRHHSLLMKRTNVVGDVLILIVTQALIIENY